LVPKKFLGLLKNLIIDGKLSHFKKGSPFGPKDGLNSPKKKGGFGRQLKLSFKNLQGSTIFGIVKKGANKEIQKEH